MKARDAIRILEADGWRLDRQIGSHRQYRHPTKPGTVTVAAHSFGQDLKKGTLASIMKQAGLEAGGSEGAEPMNAYLVVIEGDGDSFSGFCPDLPGCIASGNSPEEVGRLMREAIPLHIESLRSHGENVPPPLTRAEFVEAV